MVTFIKKHPNIIPLIISIIALVRSCTTEGKGSDNGPEPRKEDVIGQMLWGMERKQGDGQTVTIFPMNETGKVIIHGEKEAVFFTNCLLDYFR